MGHAPATPLGTAPCCAARRPIRQSAHCAHSTAWLQGMRMVSCGRSIHITHNKLSSSSKLGEPPSPTRLFRLADTACIPPPSSPSSPFSVSSPPCIGT
eukprot:1157973-Pelagomonas_calceolata.AAC.2